MQWTLRKNRSRLHGTRTRHRSLTVGSKLIENGGLRGFSARRVNCSWLLTTRPGHRSEAQSSISHIGLQSGNHWMKVHVRLSALVGRLRHHLARYLDLRSGRSDISGNPAEFLLSMPPPHEHET